MGDELPSIFANYVGVKLDRTHHYVFRIGSDNQHRLHWTGQAWQYEFIAGGVLFDQLNFPTESELEGEMAVHGLKLEQFCVDEDKNGAEYSAEIKAKMKTLTDLGIEPCAKHGLMAKNPDGSCEACAHQDYPDDFKGQEG